MDRNSPSSINLQQWINHIQTKYSHSKLYSIKSSSTKSENKSNYIEIIVVKRDKLFEMK